MVDRRRGSVGLAAAAFGEEVAAPVAGGARHGDAVLAGGGALGEEVVAGVDARPAGALGAARLLGPCLLICIISFSIDRQDSRDMLQVVKYVPCPLATAAETRRAWRRRIVNRVLLFIFTTTSSCCRH